MRMLISPHLMWISSSFAASAAQRGVTPLILWDSNTTTRFSSRSSNNSNTTTRFSSRSSNVCNFTPRLHQKRSQKVRNPKFSWGGGMPPDPPSWRAMHALITHWNCPFLNSTFATEELQAMLDIVCNGW